MCTYLLETAKEEQISSDKFILPPPPFPLFHDFAQSSRSDKNVLLGVKKHDFESLTRRSRISSVDESVYGQ